MIYYTADLHFGHSNVIEMSKRPFKDIDEMDNALIALWNRTVSNDDTVYIVGDFAYRSSRPYSYYLERLNGKKHLIIGNHDRHLVKTENLAAYFQSVQQMTVVKDGQEQIVLCHYPIAEWSGYFRGWYHIHGHIHNARNQVFEYIKTQERMLNAGVDINNYKPVTFQELFVNNQYFKNLQY
jgi:calcineurin-like phosphoesterase family protein